MTLGTDLQLCPQLTGNLADRPGAARLHRLEEHGIHHLQRRHQALRQRASTPPGHPRRQRRDRRRRIRRHRRTLGLRQVARCCAWWPGSRRSPAGEISIGGRVVNDIEPAERDIAMVFQNYALYPHMSVFDNMAYGLKIAKVPMAEIKTRVDKAAAHPRTRRAAGAQAARVVRRPAPARGHGPRHRAPAAGLPVRRAAVQPGRQAARPDPARDPEAAPRTGHHLAVRHPRPGRGHDAGAAHDRDECRRAWNSSARPRRSITGRPPPSSPASSARRR